MPMETHKGSAIILVPLKGGKGKQKGHIMAITGAVVFQCKRL